MRFKVITGNRAGNKIDPKTVDEWMVCVSYSMVITGISITNVGGRFSS